MATVTVKSTRGLVHEIVAGKHTILGDEAPPEGDDAGMDAHQLVLAALGSCQAITLRLYADRKGWDLGEVTVQLTSERIGNGKEHLESHITSTGNHSTPGSRSRALLDTPHLQRAKPTCRRLSAASIRV